MGAQGATNCRSAGQRWSDGDRTGRATSLAAASRKSDRNTRADYPNGIPVHLLQVYSNPSPSAISPQELLFRSGRSQRPEVGPVAPAGRARRFRAAQTTQVVERYLQVRNMREVAREFRVSRATVAKLLAKRGIDTSRSMKPAEVKQAVRLYEDGLSSITIGKRLGFDNHTILNALRGHGVAIRPAVGQQTDRRGERGMAT